jgi:hypothetical protein
LQTEEKGRDSRKGIGIEVFCHFAPYASRRMENAGKEAGGPAAASTNVEAVPGSSNGNGHGFVPLVTVVGFHHAR